MAFEIKLALLASTVLVLVLIQRMLVALQKRKQRDLAVRVPDGLYLFTSPSCTFCRSMKSLYDKDIEASYIKEIDVSRDAELANHFHVVSVPTVLVVHGGKVVNSFYGVTQPDKLAPWLKPS